MAAILDVCVPSRRREKKRLRDAKNNLHSRWGDTSITAPNEGCWNQIVTDTDNIRDWDVQLIKGYGSPDTCTTLVNSSPELEYEKEKVIIVDDIPSPPLPPSPKHSITITIPLPWASRKTHSRSSSINNHVTPNLASSDKPERTATSPVHYKPASGSYMEELANLTYTTSPVPPPWGLLPLASNPTAPPPPTVETSRTVNISPITILSPVDENFVKGMAEVGLMPSPGRAVQHISTPPVRNFSPPLGGPETFSRHRLSSLPTTTPPMESPPSAVGTHSPGERPWTSMSQRSSFDRPSTSIAHRPSIDRPSTSMSTQRPSFERPGTSMSVRSTTPAKGFSTGLPRVRSSSVGPSPGEAALGTQIGSQSRGPTVSQTTVRPSVLANPTQPGMRNRSSSRGPGLDRTGYMRSASREPPSHGRSASRDTRSGRERNRSRGPGSVAGGIYRGNSRPPSATGYRDRDQERSRSRSRRQHQNCSSSSSGSYTDEDDEILSSAGGTASDKRKVSHTSTLSDGNTSGTDAAVLRGGRTGLNGRGSDGVYTSPAHDYMQPRPETLFGSTSSESEETKDRSRYKTVGTDRTTPPNKMGKKTLRIKEKVFAVIGGKELVPSGDELWS